MIARIQRCAFVCAAALFLLSSEAQELPVRKVVLYKNGVGYVERGGTVSGAGQVTLTFRAEEMTDILKSLSVGASNGAVERVRFTTDESLEEKLKPFPFRIQQGENMANLLDGLRGARIQASRGQETIAGVILSAHNLPAAGDTPMQPVVTLLQERGNISTYEIASLQELRFVDAKLQQQVADYLRIVAEARNQDRRSVTIDLAQRGNTELSARYMTPMPVWKSSYRMIFGASGNPVLEGWAVVDNTSSEDWDGISLSLVSGKPVSFLTNLYPPVSVDRPFVPLPGISAVAPTLYEADMAAAPPPPPPSPAVADQAILGGVAGGRFEQLARRQKANEAALAEPQAAEMRESALASTATGMEAGALFAYYFPDRVSVRKGESVMLPFVQKPVAAERLLIFRENQPVRNRPMLAFELSNNSGLTLDGGPVTVFDGGEYAGEALFETTKQDEKRLLSYGIDLGSTIRMEPSSGQRQVQELSLLRGVMTVKSKLRSNIKYTASNADNRSKTLIVERSIRPNYEVISPQPSSKTANANRFRVEIPASGSASIEIVDEYPYEERLQISSLNEDALALYARNTAISAAARQALERILAKRREVSRNTIAIQNAEKRLQTMSASMDRVRRNMESLNRIRGQEAQVQKLAAELGTMQTQAATQEAELEGLRLRQAELEQELATMIEETTF